MSESRKLIVIGLDGLMPELVHKFASSGAAPNFARLLREGAFCEALPSPPCDTPTNWTTLATGTWTGTHGNNSFGAHHHGEEFGELHQFGRNIFPPFANVADETLSGHAQVEWFWQAAARAGKRCLLVNYPGGWPPNSPQAVVVDGSGPYSSKLVRMSTASLYSTSPRDESTLRLRVGRPTGWAEPPDSAKSPLETALVITGEASVEPTGAGWIVARPFADRGAVDPELLYCCLVLASTEERYDRLMICKGRDAQSPVAILKEGEWSDWIGDEFETPWGDREGRFKFKLRRLSEDGREIELYRTTIFNPTGWSQPEELGMELIEECFRRGQEAGRPGALETDGTKDDQPKLGPLCQVRESISDQAEGLAMVCEYLAGQGEWDVLFTQLHAPDGLNHQRMNELYPESPQYDPEKEDEAWQRYRQEMEVLDGFVGAVTERCADENTLVAVVSDHGAIPTHSTIWLAKWLIEAGLLEYGRDEDDKLVVDWEKSKIVLGDHPLAQNIWVNLKGRDPHGIVEPGEEYERVRDQTIHVLRSIVDPRNGKCPVAQVLRVEEAEHLGQWGETVGDLIYYLEPGYTNDVRVHSTGPIDPETLPDKALLANTEGQQGVHHCCHPTARLGGFSVRGIFLAAGPGIKRGYRRKVPIWTTDVAPTLAWLADLPAPRDSEGTVIADLRADEP